MKFKIFTLFSASLLVFGSCNEQEEVGRPVQIGDEISFGISAPQNEINTRTWYDTPKQDENGNWYFPVNWEDNDEIAIYCPQASQPATQLVNYKITPDPENPAISSAVTKIGEGAGLQWGSDDEHRFYGFYPASAVTGKETDGRIKSNIPIEKRVVKCEPVSTEGGMIYNGIPDTDLAYMFAYTSVKKSDLVNNPNIPLKFTPLVTILEITVNGPSAGSSPIQVSNINITGVDGNVALAGNFECLISDRSGKCTPLEDGTVTNRISIPCYNADKDEFITLNPGDKINVKAFIIPNEVSIGTRQIAITVTTLNGAAKTKTLQTDEIVPHMVNRVSLPALTSSGINYWMSNLDPNIFASELSIPGSKMSMITEANNSDFYYQKATIKQQFEAGVRAFILQTQRRKEYGAVGDAYMDVVIAGEGFLGTSPSVGRLKNLLTTIKDCIQDANEAGKTNEFAYVLLTWNDGFVSSESEWINQLANDVESWKDELNIYPDRVTPNTTLGDLAGHLVLKANYNSKEMGDALASTRTVPMMFSHWSGVFMENLPLRWGTSNSAASSDMLWYAQELTNCNTTGEGAQGTIKDKKDYIQKVFDEGVRIYNDDENHKTWLMNDLGGYNSDLSGQKRITEFTKELNLLGITSIQKRGQNAGMGLVFMNFADRFDDSGVIYRSNELIQTVIDNNFKFALRKKTSKTTRTYNAEYTNGGNAIGWDN